MRRVSNETWNRLKQEAAAQLHGSRSAGKSHVAEQARPPAYENTSTDALEISRVLKNVLHRRGE